MIAIAQVLAVWILSVSASVSNYESTSNSFIGEKIQPNSKLTASDPEVGKVMNLHGGNIKWSYDGNSGPGPLSWQNVFPTCGGTRQSPIVLTTEQTVFDPYLKYFFFWHNPYRLDPQLHMENNGKTLEVRNDGLFIINNVALNSAFKADQFHFHWGAANVLGSEHHIDDMAYPLEMHVVSYNFKKYKNIDEAITQTDGLAVLGVLFDITEEDNPVLDPIIRNIKHVRDPETRTSIPLPELKIRDLLPEETGYSYMYRGSLTTPGYFESVTWIVFDTKQTISAAQLKEFRTLLQFRNGNQQDPLVNNFRPTQPTNSRVVYRSFKLRENVPTGQVNQM